MEKYRRYEGLDHLRGLLALAVMFYHFSLWLGYDESLPFYVQRPLKLLGLYAVATFYCLSGAALYIVYRSRDLNFEYLREFLIKRSFRILPLFWVATTISLALSGFAALENDSWRIFLSYSTLFSWLDPSAYFTPGAWSIGNEWAFYSLFPLLLVGWKFLWSRILIVAASVVASSYYAFVYIDPSLSLSEQWPIYIAPLNQIVLFVGGIAAGSAIVARAPSISPLAILWGASLLFLAISYSFRSQTCFYGFSRIALIGICIAWCYGAGCLVKKSGKVGSVLDWLGALSYSIYLLHPIAFRVVNKAMDLLLSRYPFLKNGEYWVSILVLLVSVVVTLVVSYCSYTMLEKPLVGVGKSLASRARKGSATPSS